MIKLVDLIIEKRSNANKNQKIPLATKILEFANHDDLFVSFTALPKIGINPKSNYNTPLGLYCYPLKMAKKVYSPNNNIGISFPFATEHPYLYILKKNSGIRELNVSTYTKEQGNQDIDRLINIYSHLFQDKLEHIKQSSRYNTKFTNLEIGAFWYFCRQLSEDIAVIKKTKPTIIWNILLYKNLGYDLVTDELYMKMKNVRHFLQIKEHLVFIKCLTIHIRRKELITCEVSIMRH